jgi:hypothetical protein
VVIYYESDLAASFGIKPLKNIPARACLCVIVVIITYFPYQRFIFIIFSSIIIETRAGSGERTIGCRTSLKPTLGILTYS